MFPIPSSLCPNVLYYTDSELNDFPFLQEMYCAVEFTSKEGRSAPCSIVPLLWLVNNNTQVYWPPTVNKNKFEEMVRNQAPCNLTWRTFPVKKVLFKSSTYEEAERRLESFQSSTEESENSNIEQFTPPIFLDESAEDTEIIFSDSLARCNDGCRNDIKLDGMKKSINEIAREVAKISTVQEQILLMLNNISSFIKSEQSIETSPFECPSFPLKTEEDFDKFEDEMRNPEHEKFMVNRLKSMGGNSPEDHTRRILRFLLSNDLACQYNWKGREKKPFKDTKSMEVIYVAVKKEFAAATDLQIADATKDWLKFATKRLKDAASRKEKKI